MNSSNFRFTQSSPPPPPLLLLQPGYCFPPFPCSKSYAYSVNLAGMSLRERKRERRRGRGGEGGEEEGEEARGKSYQVSDIDKIMKRLLSMLSGNVRLECRSETVYNYAHSDTAFDGLSPPEYFIMFPGSPQEPLLNFFSHIGYPILFFVFLSFSSLFPYYNQN